MDSPFYPAQPVRTVHFGDAAADALAAQKQKELARDIGAAVAAFSLPIAYGKWAPRKWPRSPNLFVDVAAVIGVYFAARYTINVISGV
jgi:hypothetical protein